MKATSVTKKVEEEKKQVKQEITTATSTQAQGESLLLPLLQGLLHKNTPQARSQISTEASIKPVNNNTSGSTLDSSKPNSKVTQPIKPASTKYSDNMYSSTAHHVEDSGTESGEDLKFIAAGLRDSMQIHSKDQSDGDLISEVTAALNRLEQSLKEGNDLKLEASKKNALLNLVGRLQTSLISPDKITAPTPNPRDDDETSSPEADARRGSRPGHQRFAKRRNRANRHTVGVSREELADARRYIEEMVMMESLSNCTTPESTAITPPEFNVPAEKQTNPGKDIGPESTTLYRPNQFVPSHLKDSSNNQLASPGVQLRDKKPKYTTARQSANVEPLSPIVGEESINKRPLSESYDYNQNPVQNMNRNHTSQYNMPPDQVVLEKNLYNQTHHSVQQSGFNGLRPSAYTAENADSKFNRFSNKKLMMKRANTIDIPKPMKYLHDMESDSEAEERGISSTKGIGLRGTVQVSVKSKPRQVVPPFQPKTENDHKFLAFIQKQTPSPGIGWNNPNKSHSTTVNNWSNKFGNIKNAFETGAIATTGKPPVPASSARNFWKKNESYHPQVDRVIKPPWAERGGDVLTGALKAKQQLEDEGAYVPKPSPVNKFSHAPLSAFRPVESVPVFPQNQFQPIHPNSQQSYPVFANQTLKSPTKSFFAGRAVSNSPTSGLPWVTKPNVEHRVLSMAASKFESKSPTSGLQRHGSLREHEKVNPHHNTRVVEQKRPSLPNTSVYNADLNAPQLVQNYQNGQTGSMAHEHQPGGFPHLPYTCTDYTEPSCVSTYIPEQQRDREDSLTNPNSEPLILTSNRPIISPNMHAQHQQQPLKIFDYPSSPDSVNQTLNDITDDELDSNLTEYKAESKVMRGPVSQQAVTVSNRAARVGDDEKYGRNSKAAKSLLSAIKNISNGKPSEKKPTPLENKPIPQTCISPDGSSYQAPHVEPVFPALTSPTTNRMPTYIAQQPNVNVQYQTQRSVPHQSQPPTPQSQVSSVSYPTQSSIPYSPGSQRSAPQTPPSSVPYQTQSSIPYSPGSLQSQPQFPQARTNPPVPYQTQRSIPYSSHPTTPQSPQYPTGYYQQNLAYVPPVQQQQPISYQQTQFQHQQQIVQQQQQQEQIMQQQRQQQIIQQQQQQQQIIQQQQQQQIIQQQQQIMQQQQQQKQHPQQQPNVIYQQQYTPKQQQVFARNQENIMVQPKGQVQPRGPASVPQQTQIQQQKQIQTAQSQLYKQSSQEGYKKSYEESKAISQQRVVQKTQQIREAPKKVQEPVSVPKPAPASTKQSVQQVVGSTTITKSGQQSLNQKSYSVEETKKQAIRQMQRQDATEGGHKKQVQQKEVKTTISAKASANATKTVTSFTTSSTQQKSSVTSETQVYKSSQPADTPDIVKSSLPKEDFPILKKFGPSRPHLYQPNAYQNPLAKSASTKQANVVLAQGPPANRKFSEPYVVTKFTAPEIVETPSTPLPAAKDEIPANIVCRNIAQFSSMARRSFDSSVESTATTKFTSIARPNPLSKSDSWHQIVQQQNAMKPPSPKGFASSEGNPLRRAKSGHSLAIPKMYEAGINKEELVGKKKTVEAYFSGQKSPNSLSRNSSQTNIAEMAESSKTATGTVTVKKSSVSRIKTTEKTSIGNQSPGTGLARSQTMPHIASLHLLDESNVDDAFEQLLNNS